MRIFIALVSVILLFACRLEQGTFTGHQLQSDGQTLTIQYRGEGDVVQFKMFEGLELILSKTVPGQFEGHLEIPQLDDAIFSYSITIHQQDSNGKMVEIPYQPDNGDYHFRWIGKNRTVPFEKAAALQGTLLDSSITSKFLEEKRGLTIYYPEKISPETPIIYLTDGSEVNAYAPFVDHLITTGTIKPVILVGVHASRENRYFEYVNNGIKEDIFERHRDFFFQEVIPEIENGLGNWHGSRYIYGFSNGAAFGMYAGLNHPDLFEEVIAFSTVDYIPERLRTISFDYEHYPAFYMRAGRYEEDVFRENTQFVKKMIDHHIEVDFGEFISGHDYYVWQVGFLEYLTAEFGK
ncbi:MAG: alpha/beta hydrolase-fold protein [Saprospiraceae bacterium]|nr:hypothetical protein [Lewinella sp.]